MGEIYVRRDNFSVEEVSQMLISKGIYPKVTGVTEWIHYTDFARKFIMEGRRKREGWLRTLLHGGLKDEAVYLIDKIWKENVEEKIVAALRPTGLIPHVPHDMNEIIGEGQTRVRRSGAGKRGNGVAGGGCGGDEGWLLRCGHHRSILLSPGATDRGGLCTMGEGP